MVQLDEARIDSVLSAIRHEFPGGSSLEDELLDHFCCFIEEQMADGTGFEESLQKAFQSIAPHGIEEIEEELHLLLNFKPQTIMKRLFYVSAFIVTFSLMFSLLSRHWHWDTGANYMQLAGNLALLFLLLPSVSVMAIRNSKLLSKMDIFRMFTGILAGVALSTGMIFKALHFPYANILISSGMLALMFVFLPVFFWQLYKRSY
jgi:hypothetical protein